MKQINFKTYLDLQFGAQRFDVNSRTGHTFLPTRRSATPLALINGGISYLPSSCSSHSCFDTCCFGLHFYARVPYRTAWFWSQLYPVAIHQQPPTGLGTAFVGIRVGICLRPFWCGLAQEWGRNRCAMRLLLYPYLDKGKWGGESRSKGP